MGRLTPEKGISTLLEAWRQIGNDLPVANCRRWSAGARKWRKPAGEMESVTWLKWLPRAEILQRMKDASVLILPSTWYEGFPMILAEAFAVGLPVIASDLGSMSSIVDHQRTGLHFEAGQRQWAGRGGALVDRPPCGSRADACSSQAGLSSQIHRGSELRRS